MLHKLSRYLLVLIGILTLAYSIPILYNTLFDKRINTPQILYSALNDDFYIRRHDDKKVLNPVDTKGKEYTQTQMLEQCPMFYAPSLHQSGLLPDSIDGVKIDIETWHKHFIMYGFLPQSLMNPSDEYRLFPLYEATEKITLPGDLCRINKRVEFVNTQSNKVNEEKSGLFTDAFEKEGFVFPAKIMAGNSSHNKNRVDGWFITDQRGDLFHLKMEKGQPLLKRIALPEDFKIKYMQYLEVQNEKLYCFIITEDNRLNILYAKDYEIVELPIYDYIPEEHSIYIMGNMLFYMFQVNTENSVAAYAVDHDHNIMDSYYEEFKPKSEMLMGKAFHFIFPFTLKLTHPRSDIRYTNYVKFNFEGFKTFNWIYLNLLLLVITYLLIRKRKLRLKNNMVDLLIVAATGIFGFIAINVFQNKEY
ncbi:DUF4857 domain-containing protein [Maribellus luteus]|uniref:DUF4857 domain-containing protein n=1 Tax=Maribellus luteus TaxID=2305463 RepID=A0A399T0C6_9BACT|nr:DUF4857 domain-containing protein [Maribellus luteus]RIJ49880.1 DUF4857 domain-containing protein [Maribellus luteus]